GNSRSVARNRNRWTNHRLKLIEDLLLDVEIFNNALNHERTRREIGKRLCRDVALGPFLPERCRKTGARNQFVNALRGVIARPLVRVRANRITDNAKSMRQ